MEELHTGNRPLADADLASGEMVGEELARQLPRGLQGRAMKQSCLIYCRCGHEIWCETFVEENLVSLVFFDDVESSETYAEQIVQCPGCGRLPAERLLESQRSLA